MKTVLIKEDIISRNNERAREVRALTREKKIYYVNVMSSPGGGARLFVTTNLTGEELAERYTARLTSRLKELCIPLHLKGADKRKWSAAKGVAKSAERVYNNALFSTPTMEGSEK